MERDIVLDLQERNCGQRAGVVLSWNSEISHRG